VISYSEFLALIGNKSDAEIRRRLSLPADMVSAALFEEATNQIADSMENQQLPENFLEDTAKRFQEHRDSQPNPLKPAVTTQKSNLPKYTRY
jgi:hypothetical protein